MGSDVEVTEADRKKARLLATTAATERMWNTELGVQYIAQALADERAKARVPFLAVADELKGWQDNALRFAAHAQKDATTGAMARARAMAYGRAIDRIRRAAQDPPEVSET